ncbi:MAG: serine--tRNA ligase, partial [Candidatus Moraniibacteriota bacterium]
MLDIQYIRDRKDEVAKAAEAKHIALDVNELLVVDKERVRLLQELEELYSLKNDINDLIAKATPEERSEILAKGKEIKQKIEVLEPEFGRVKKSFDGLMAQVPTVPSLDTPLGASDADNVEVLVHGEKRVFGFTPKNHIELGKSLDILDLERGTKVGGYRGYYLKNEGALLVMGLMMYAVQKLVSKGYQPMIPPTLVKGFALFGSGYFKGVEYDAVID